MNATRSAFGLASLCLMLLFGPVPSSASTTELLYVQEGQYLVTYSVSNTTAVTKKLGSLNLSYAPMAQKPSGSLNLSYTPIARSGSFLYVSTSGSVTVYPLTAAGVPIAKPVQTLIVKSALTQFYIHPNGVFAYAFFSWQKTVGGTQEYAADIVLFTINPKTGKLTNTKKNLQNFPLSQDYIYPNLMNNMGTEIFTTDINEGYCHTCSGPTYSAFAINPKTGMLSPGIVYWGDNLGATSLFGSSLLVSEDSDFQVRTEGPNTQALVDCTTSMLQVCGDSIPNVAFHPSGAYIFPFDYTTNEVPVLYVSVPKAQLIASGASIPGIPYLIAFSPDGLLVYAAEGSEILVYVFNPHTGLLTARTTIATPKGAGSLLAAQ